MTSTARWTIVGAMAVLTLGVTSVAQAQQAETSFFITSVGSGKGGDLGGLAGADAYCQKLASAAGSKRSWRAYLSTQGNELTDKGVIHARDRIGNGPWYNAKGAMIAKNVDDLHSEHANITKQSALTEKGEPVKGRGDQPNEHDILTGSDPSGRFSTAGGDTTCGNWTKSGEGSAIVGHADRQGLKDTWHMKSWNSSHGSRGCSQDQLKASGGAGLIYCFVPN